MYYYLPLFFTFLNLFITVVLFYYSFYLFKKEKKLEEQNKQGLLDYEKTLENATKKAKYILEHTDIISSTVKDSFESSINNVTSNIKKNTEDYLKRVLIDQELMISNFTKNITDEYTKKINKSINVADKKYLESQKSMDLQVKQLVKNMEEEVKKYKEAKINNIDSYIKSELMEILKNSLPKYISIENQEEMVIEVIEKAKESGLFKLV